MEENKVELIIGYLEGKIEHLKEKLAKYDSPMMQDLAKGSQHMQVDYIRIQAQLNEVEDDLLAIRKFCSPPKEVKNDGSGRKKADKTKVSKN